MPGTNFPLAKNMPGTSIILSNFYLSPHQRLISILAFNFFSSKKISFHNISTSIITFVLLTFISLFLSSNTHINTNIYIIFAQDLKWSQSVELMDSSSMQKKEKSRRVKTSIEICMTSTPVQCDLTFDLTSQIRFQEIDSNFVYNFPTNL